MDLTGASTFFGQSTADKLPAPPYSAAVQIAFKEWAVVADSLGRGEQIIILRKGGISEGRGGFQIEHRRFFLFPTLFHQQRESVLPAAQARYDVLAPGFAPAGVLRLEYFADVEDWKFLDSFEAARRLHGQHVWCEEVIRDRFDWGRSKCIHALAVRVFRLPQPVELPMRAEYGGCKSWVELEGDIPTGSADPVLDDRVFAIQLERFRTALDSSNRPPPSGAPASGTLAHVK